MSDITPLVVRTNFVRPFWPDRQPANDLPFCLPTAGAAGTLSGDSEYKLDALASARDDGQQRLPQRPNLLTLSFFGDACLP